MGENQARGFDPLSLRRLRRQAGLKVYELADALGTDRSAVYLWEHGRRTPRMPTLVRIAEILGVEVSELIGEPGTLAELRAAAGLTQAQLATRLGWSRTQIGAIETGQRRLDEADHDRYAQALGIDQDQLRAALDH